jgi:ribose transport system permease protein
MNARGLTLASLPISRVPGVAIVLVVLCVIFGLTSPGFTTPANIANILSQSTILLLLALPMTVIIMTEGLDLSIGAVLTFASILLAVTVLATGSVTLSLLAALAVGICFGLGNGVLIAAFDIPASRCW